MNIISIVSLKPVEVLIATNGNVGLLASSYMDYVFMTREELLIARRWL